MADAPDRAFYYDLASPLAYLVAERILHVLPFPCEWRGVLARELPAGATPATTTHKARALTELRPLVELRAAELELMPLRWPAQPLDSELAMRAATYAASIGRGVPFALAAFRQAYAGGHDLGELDWILVAAAACEMHPSAVTKALDSARVGQALADATAQAATRGVREIPAIVTPEGHWEGEDCPERAAAAFSPAGSTAEG